MTDVERVTRAITGYDYDEHVNSCRVPLALRIVGTNEVVSYRGMRDVRAIPKGCVVECEGCGCRWNRLSSTKGVGAWERIE